LSKYLVILAAMLLGSVAIAEGSLQIFKGTFQDGAVMKWVCPPGAAGTIPFQFTTPDGGVYEAAVKCGEAI
jgi:hypothetical protein